MSREVEFADVRRRIDEFGARAILVTVSERGTPHAVSVVVEVDGDRLRTAVGTHTTANLRDRPAVSLLWEPVLGGEYHLILDGLADHIADAPTEGGTAVSIAVTNGIVHRLAGLAVDGPTCIAVGAR